MSKKGWMRQLPNLLTLINMGLGVGAVLVLVGAGGVRKTACELVLVAALADACDGSLARLLGTQSGLGKQLDSFADSISFGLAPVAILYSFPVLQDSLLVTIFTMLFVIAGCFRLARYNLSQSSDFFLGLPITVAGCMVAIYALVLDSYSRIMAPGMVRLLTILLLVALASAMVSRVKIKRPQFNGKWVM